MIKTGADPGEIERFVNTSLANLEKEAAKLNAKFDKLHKSPYASTAVGGLQKSKITGFTGGLVRATATPWANTNVKNIDADDSDGVSTGGKTAQYHQGITLPDGTQIPVEKIPHSTIIVNSKISWNIVPDPNNAPTDQLSDLSFGTAVVHVDPTSSPVLKVEGFKFLDSRMSGTFNNPTYFQAGSSVRKSLGDDKSTNYGAGVATWNPTGSSGQYQLIQNLNLILFNRISITAGQIP